MCYFITLAVPLKHAAFARDTMPRQLAIHSTANRWLRASLPADYEMLLITSGWCSCELYGQDQPERTTSRDDHLRRSYAKRGWSPAKIERAVAQSLANKKQMRQLIGYRADVVDFVATIVARSSTAALLAHWYRGGVEEARIDVGASLRTDLEGLRQATPDPDQWLWIRESV